MELPTHFAKRIINSLNDHERPPERGVEYYSVGLDVYINVITNEYLKDSLTHGLSAFKILVGEEGAGKSHFFHLLRESAWNLNYLVCIVISENEESVLNKPEELYKAIVKNLVIKPSKPDFIAPKERGLDIVLKNWYHSLRNRFDTSAKKKSFIDAEIIAETNSVIRTLESLSFSKAIQQYILALINNDTEAVESLNRWFYGQDIIKNERERFKKRFRIYEKLDKTLALKFIRSLCQFVFRINCNGLCIFILEKSKQMEKKSRSKVKKLALDNLRQIIDECGYAKLPGTLIIYALSPNIERNFSDYRALQDRVSSNFPFNLINPSSARIDLNKLEEKESNLLYEIGLKLIDIYEKAYPNQNFLEQANLKQKVKEIAVNAIKNRIGVSQRKLFIKNLLLYLNQGNEEKVEDIKYTQKLEKIDDSEINEPKTDEAQKPFPIFPIEKKHIKIKNEEFQITVLIIFQGHSIVINEEFMFFIPHISNYLRTLDVDEKREFLQSEIYKWRRKLNILNLSNEQKKNIFYNYIKNYERKSHFKKGEINVILDMDHDEIFYSNQSNALKNYFQEYKLNLIDEESLYMKIMEYI